MVEGTRMLSPKKRNPFRKSWYLASNNENLSWEREIRLIPDDPSEWSKVMGRQKTSLM